MTSKNKMDYIQQYSKEHYERIIVNFKKGTKSRIMTRCDQLGINMSEYIRNCIEKEIEKNSNN